MALIREYEYDDGVAAPEQLLNEIINHYQCYVSSTRLDNQAHHLTELANKISDLKSWMPGYDAETGTIPWDREDEEYA